MSALAENIRTGVAEAARRAASIRVAIVFGSFASGRIWGESDLDVAVRWDVRLSPDERRRAELAFIAALTDALGPLGERADVTDLDRASSAIAFRAIRDGVCVFARSDADRVRTVVDVSRRYDDDAPRRELFRRSAVETARRLAEDPHGRS